MIKINVFIVLVVKGALKIMSGWEKLVAENTRECACRDGFTDINYMNC